MNSKHKLLMLFAMIHLGLAALGAAAIPMGTPDNIPLIEWYRHVTGTDNSFSFFAPNVGAQERVVFVLHDADGNTWTDTLRIGPNHEANMCFETVPFVLAATDDPTAWNMLKSMSHTMLDRHPTATRVTVRVEAYAAAWETENPDTPNIDFPRMSEFRDGKRPEWLLKYEVNFPTTTEAIASEATINGDQS